MAGKRAMVSGTVLLCSLRMVEAGEIPQKRSEEQRPCMSLLVYNYAKAPEDMLSLARDVAKEVLHRIRVDLVWVYPTVAGATPASCSAHPAIPTSQFTIMILPQALGAFRERPQTMGFAPVSGSINSPVLIFYDRVLAFSSAQRPGVQALILGYVIMHELGHLLLGPSHSPSGLMHAQWNANSATQLVNCGLFFGEEESRKIRTALRGRKRE